MSLIDPSKIVVDDSASGIEISAIADVSAPNWPLKEGKYIVWEGTPPKSEAWIFTAMSCFAWARTNVQDPPGSSEGVEMIKPEDGNGFFLFEPKVGKGFAWGLSFVRQAAWTTAAGATAADMKTGSGVTLLSNAPFDSVGQSGGNDIRRFIVPPGQPLVVLFSLVPDAISNPLPARFAIGGTGPIDDNLNRVDFAGVYMSGVRVPKGYYDELVRKQQKKWT